MTMTEATLERIRKNPHYKHAGIEREIEPPVVEFGVLPLHDTEVKKHQVALKKKKR